MTEDEYDDINYDELIYSDEDDIPPHPSETLRQPYRRHRNEWVLHHDYNDIPPYGTNMLGILDVLARIADGIINSRNPILYIILIFVGILFWPIGLFLLVCFLSRVFKR